jgi:hypothetical protein
VIPIIMDAIINFTNFTSDGIFSISFAVYLSIFGDLFWGMLFGIIGGALYASNRSIGVVTTYLIIVGSVLGILLPIFIIPIFGIILGFALTIIFYKTFVEKK